MWSGLARLRSGVCIVYLDNSLKLKNIILFLNVGDQSINIFYYRIFKKIYTINSGLEVGVRAGEKEMRENMIIFSILRMAGEKRKK